MRASKQYAGFHASRHHHGGGYSVGYGGDSSHRLDNTSSSAYCSRQITGALGSSVFSRTNESRGDQPVVRSITRRQGQEQVLAEYVVEHEVRVPKRMTREDVIERTYIIPERVVVEEIVEENAKYVERVVEIAHPVLREKIVEVPEYEYIEKIVEVPQIIYREKIREQPRIEYKERIIEVPKLISVDKVVNVPVYEYNEIPVEKIVEVPRVQEHVLIKEISVPQYVDKPVAQHRQVEVLQDVDRKLPLPVESLTTLELVLPRLRPVYQRTEVPVYIPRFVEVPVAAEFCDEDFLEKADRCVQEVTNLMTCQNNEPLSLCALETAASMIQDLNFEARLSNQKFSQNFDHWWKLHQISFEGSVQSVCQTVDKDGAVVTESVSVIRKSAPAAMGEIQRRLSKFNFFPEKLMEEDDGNRDTPRLSEDDESYMVVEPAHASCDEDEEKEDMLLTGHSSTRGGSLTTPLFPEMSRLSTSMISAPLAPSRAAAPEFGSSSSVGHRDEDEDLISSSVPDIPQRSAIDAQSLCTLPSGQCHGSEDADSEAAAGSSFLA